MDAYKLQYKFFFADPAAIHLEAAVPVFHRWIQTHAIANHVLIDVADYAHVINGPGIVLISHEANFSIDLADNRPGLLYVRKRPLDGTFSERLSAIGNAALQTAAKLEAELPGFRFDTSKFLLGINDRLLAPNTPETFAATKADLEKFAQRLAGGSSASVGYQPNSDRIFEVEIKLPAAQTPAVLAQRLA